jgi:four helix bundle protein
MGWIFQERQKLWKVSGYRKNLMREKIYVNVEILEVYQMLYQLHMELCKLTHGWPQEESYDLGSRLRRSSNSAIDQISDKNHDRALHKKIEGIHRGKGEVAETIHLLFMTKLRGYITEKAYMGFRRRFIVCLRMLNGLEKTLERKVSEHDRR